MLPARPSGDSSLPLRSPLFIGGATATGKSEVALLLAERLGGEIISVDSMQVYRGLDIGTAKPSAAERQRVRHHLIDIVDLTEPFDAARFVTLARQAVEEIQGRGRIPIFCGGTGLYFKAFLEGLGAAPAGDPVLRRELEKMPLADLLRELAERDPVTFEQIDRQNPRRVIRAVEVIRSTGQPFSAQRAAWSRPSASGPEASPARCFGFVRSLGDLRTRIDARVDWMFDQGLVEETRPLLQGGLAGNPTAMQAIGYRQVVEHLRGERSLGETITLVKVRTRHFAKRQMTWFRRQLPVAWIPWEPGGTPEDIAGQILQQMEAAG